jgi:hypothetical protein
MESARVAVLCISAPIINGIFFTIVIIFIGDLVTERE